MTSKKSKSPDSDDIAVRLFSLKHDYKDPFGNPMTKAEAKYYIDKPDQYIDDKYAYEMNCRLLKTANKGKPPLTPKELFELATPDHNTNIEKYKQKIRSFFIDKEGKDPYGRTMSYATINLYMQDDKKWGREVKALEQEAEKEAKETRKSLKSFPKAPTTTLHVEDPAKKAEYIANFLLKYQGTKPTRIEEVYNENGLEGLIKLEKHIKAYENAMQRSFGSSTTSKRWGGHRQATKGRRQKSRRRALRQKHK